MCSKIKYDSALGARKAMRIINAIRNRRGKGLKKQLKTIYFCKECHGYHLSSKSEYAVINYERKFVYNKKPIVKWNGRGF